MKFTELVYHKQRQGKVPFSEHMHEIYPAVTGHEITGHEMVFKNIDININDSTINKNSVQDFSFSPPTH